MNSSTGPHLQGRNQVRIWNDSSVIDACISFSRVGVATVTVDVSASSATFCRRLPARSELSYDITSNVRLFCVSSASMIAGPNVYVTQLKK